MCEGIVLPDPLQIMFVTTLPFKLIWATAWQNQDNPLYTQWRQPSLITALYGKLRARTFLIWTAETLIRLGAQVFLLLLSCSGSFFLSLLLYAIETDPNFYYEPCNKANLMTCYPKKTTPLATSFRNMFYAYHHNTNIINIKKIFAWGGFTVWW